MVKSVQIAWLFAFLPFAYVAEAQNSAVRMNQIQAIGTHNSYRLAPPRELLSLIAIGSPKEAEALDYAHLPIVDQLNELKIRQLELDLYADPNGGLFANPIGYATLSRDQKETQPHPNANGALDAPGMKVLHSPGFDYRSTEPTFVAALRSIRQWSQSHRSHIPILILVELKQSAVGPVLVNPVPFDREQLDSVDREIRSVFGEDEFISPDQIRDQHKHLRDAVAANGWPLLEDVRGQVWFAMDNEGDIRDLYLHDHPSLRGRAMFVSVPPEHSAAAFRKLNDPVGQFREIQRAVHGGLIVRTRADAETRQARSGDTSRRDKAFQSGAQFISTDYPIPDPRWTDYQVNLPGHAEYRVIPRSLLSRDAPNE